MKRLIVVAATTAALVVPGSAPAFHHVFIPGGECGNSPNSGGNNPTARDALLAAGHTFPLPPGPGSEAAEHEQAPSECPAERR